jgi:hypothetical protein
MVIDGHVQARLLGLRLLELDAHVVVGAAPRTGAVGGAPVDARSRQRRDDAFPAAASHDGRRSGDRSDVLPLARAQRLLAEGSTVLAGARRIR